MSGRSSMLCRTFWSPCQTFFAVNNRQILNPAGQNVRQGESPLPDISRTLPDMSGMSGIFREDWRFTPSLRDRSLFMTGGRAGSNDFLRKIFSRPTRRGKKIPGHRLCYGWQPPSLPQDNKWLNPKEKQKLSYYIVLLSLSGKLPKVLLM